MPPRRVCARDATADHLPRRRRRPRWNERAEASTTEPTDTDEQTSQDRATEEPARSGSGAPANEDSGQPAVSEGELDELARTQEDVAQRARRLVAGEPATHAPNGDRDDRRVRQLLISTRADLLAELRQQEQAPWHMAEATRSSEDAVAGVVQGITTMVRSIVPAVLVRPEDVIEAMYALADQGLRVGRRMALTVASSTRRFRQAHGLTPREWQPVSLRQGR